MAERTYVMELRYTIPEWVHPAGAATIHHWINDAFRALDNLNFAEAARLGEMILAKIRQERAWRPESPWTPKS
jgi:hypothetical protein